MEDRNASGIRARVAISTCELPSEFHSEVSREAKNIGSAFIPKDWKCVLMQKPVMEAPSSIHSQRPLEITPCPSPGEGRSGGHLHHRALLSHREEGTEDTPVLGDLQGPTEGKSQSLRSQVV